MRVDLLQRFSDLVGPADAAVPLFEASLAYSAALQDGAVWPEARAARREIEEAVTHHCAGLREAGEVAIVEGVLGFLRTRHFVGNVDRYEDPRNSLMDRVLERRLGLPITLSALAMHLSECCKVELHGIGFPGHFLVGLQLDGDDPLVWDPFRGGRRLQLDELAALYTTIVGQHVEPDSPQLRAHLRPCPSRLWLTRMLENLRRHFAMAGEPNRVGDTLELLAALHPGVERIRELLARHAVRKHLLN